MIAPFVSFLINHARRDPKNPPKNWLIKYKGSIGQGTNFPFYDLRLHDIETVGLKWPYDIPPNIPTSNQSTISP